MKSGDSDRLGKLVDEGIDCYAILGWGSKIPNLPFKTIQDEYNKIIN